MSTNELASKAAEVIGQLQMMAPKASAVALASVKADAISTLITGGTSLVMLAATAWFFRAKFLPWAKSFDRYDDMPAIFAGIGLSVWALILAISALVSLLDPWTYIALSHPDLWIAHKLIGGGLAQ